MATESLSLVTLPRGYAARAATQEDLDRVMAVIQAADVADWGSPDFTEQMLRYEWTMPELDMATDTWVIERDGEVCAYTWLLARSQHRELDGYGVVHPDHRGRGVGSALVDLVERRAAEHAAAAAGEPVRFRFGVIGPDVAAHELLERRGFELVRHFWKMVTRLEPPVPEPLETPGIRIRGFEAGADGPALHATLTEAFQGHFGFVARSFEDWAVHNLHGPDFDPALWFVAADAATGEVVGELIGLEMDGSGYVGSVGVRSAWRGRGIGAALLRTAFRAFAARGLLEVSLDVDSANATGAVALYERVGMHASRRYDIFARTIVGGNPAATDTTST